MIFVPIGFQALLARLNDNHACACAGTSSGPRHQPWRFRKIGPPAITDSSARPSLKALGLKQRSLKSAQLAFQILCSATVSFTTSLAACSLVTGAFALPGNHTRRAGSGKSSGTNNGKASVLPLCAKVLTAVCVQILLSVLEQWRWQCHVHHNGNAGQCSIQWSNAGDFTAGKDWNPGSSQ